MNRGNKCEFKFWFKGLIGYKHDVFLWQTFEGGNSLEQVFLEHKKKLCGYNLQVHEKEFLKAFTVYAVSK